MSPNTLTWPAVESGAATCRRLTTATYRLTAPSAVSEPERSHHRGGVCSVRPHGGARLRRLQLGRHQNLGPRGGPASADAHRTQEQHSVYRFPSVRRLPGFGQLRHEYQGEPEMWTMNGSDLLENNDDLTVRW